MQAVEETHTPIVTVTTQCKEFERKALSESESEGYTLIMKDKGPLRTTYHQKAL